MLWSLHKYGIETKIVDPWVDPEDALREYGLEVESNLPEGSSFCAVLVLVPHQHFRQLNESQWQELLVPGGVLFDLKGIVPRQLQPLRI